MNLIEKTRKVVTLTEKLRNSIDTQLGITEGFSEYLRGYKNTFNLEEKDLANRYIDDTINILLSYVKLLNDVKQNE